MVDNPIELVLRSQQLALKMATDTLRVVRDTAVTGVTQPDELLTQVAGLRTAVTQLAGSIGRDAADGTGQLGDRGAAARDLGEEFVGLG
ncbi:MAG: hypothetical protein EOO74_06265, partial [Myxococcales bacterium]